MKKLISIFFILFAFLANAQDLSPLPSITVKKLIAPCNPTFYYNLADSSMYEYSDCNGWYRFARKADIKNNKVTSINFTGTTTKTLTLNQIYGGTKTATFTDLDQQTLNTSASGTTRTITISNGNSIAIDIKNYVFNGACQIPAIIDNGNGSVTLGSGRYHLATEPTGIESYMYDLAGGTFTLTNDAQNYIVADYNSGSPLVKLISDVTLINETTIVPVYSIYRNGNFLHTQNWDALGLALANKVHQSIVKTQRYRRESGLALSVSGTRNLNLTVGRVWTGAVPISLDAIATATDNLYFWHHTGGVWTSTVTTQFPNTQYDNGTNLTTLTPNRYAVIWAFRGVESQKHLYCVVGTGDYTLTQAEAATLPATPTAINSHAMLVGKIIVQNGTNTPTSVQSAFDTTFGLAPIQNHGDLTGRDALDSHPAGAITYTPYSTTTATTVATAIDELTDEKEPVFFKGDLKTGTPALTVTNGTARLVGSTATISITSGYRIPTTTEFDSFIQGLTITGTTLGLTGTSTTVTLPTPSTCSITTTANTVVYGALYNGYAANDARNIANNGWHLPNYNEWNTLVLYTNQETAKIKDTDSKYWTFSSNSIATNVTKFNWRGAGLRENGSFSQLRNIARAYSSTLQGYDGNGIPGHYIIATTYSQVSWGLNGVLQSDKSGLSVRLIKDATTLSNGQIGTYVGNDGKVYRTICIGTQEWLADNLAETKYRDGSTIPIVTDNSAWEALTTGAMCYYNNDINNAVGTVSSTLCNDLTNLQTQLDSKDPSITNEGSLSLSGGTATRVTINSNTSGSIPVVIGAAGLNTLSTSGNTVTITATPQGLTRVGDVIGMTSTTTTITISDKLPVTNVSGTSGYLSKFSSTNSINDSKIRQNSNNIQFVSPDELSYSEFNTTNTELNIANYHSINGFQDIKFLGDGGATIATFKHSGLIFDVNNIKNNTSALFSGTVDLIKSDDAGFRMRASLYDKNASVVANSIGLSFLKLNADLSYNSLLATLWDYGLTVLGGGYFNTLQSNSLIGTGTRMVAAVSDGVLTSAPVTVSGNNISVIGSVQVGNDSNSASSTNVGAIRYRTSGNNSYCEMVMQTGASTYDWVIIKQNSW